jgi:hypothetical protein
MPRIRSVKPEFWVSEQVNNCTIPARLQFIGLWNFSDDEGRHVASPRKLKCEVFPGDDDVTVANVRSWIDELRREGLVVEYDGGEHGRLWQITGWHHQRIVKRMKSKFPPANRSNIIPVEDGKPVAIPETDGPLKSPDDFQLCQIWNARAAECEKRKDARRLHPVVAVNAQREAKIRERMQSLEFVDLFRRAVAAIPVEWDESDWQPDFDYFIENSSRVLKPLEGWDKWTNGTITDHESKSTPDQQNTNADFAAEVEREL